MITIKIFGPRTALGYTNAAILYGLFNDVLSQIIKAKDESPFHGMHEEAHYESHSSYALLGTPSLE
jgi:hypothetical protein